MFLQVLGDQLVCKKAPDRTIQLVFYFLPCPKSHKQVLLLYHVYPPNLSSIMPINTFNFFLPFWHFYSMYYTEVKREVKCRACIDIDHDAMTCTCTCAQSVIILTYKILSIWD